MTRKRWMGLLVLIVIGGMGWISYRAFHQATLDRDLIAVSAKGDPSRVRALLAQGADPNTSEDETAGRGWQHLLNLLLRRARISSHTYPLTLALTGPTPSDANHIEVIRLLLEHGANPNVVNANGDSAMNWASEHQNTTLITLLLTHGADVNHKNRQGVTALTYALITTRRQQREEATRILLEAGANVNAQDQQGCSPFQFALIIEGMARQIHDVNLSRMLAHGADVRTAIPASATTQRLALSIQTGNSSMSVSSTFSATPGTTPLMFASRDGDADLVRSMLAKGADVNARDADGKTALDYAKYFPEIRLLLQQARVGH